jgi:ferrochelatase
MAEKQKAVDAVLVIAFGGPKKLEDIRPFLTRVTRGRVPPERLEAVARHYELFDGKSPVNEITSSQANGLKLALENKGTRLPVYIGMRNWHPLLVNTLSRMASDGVQKAVGVIMSVFQSKSSWDQYHGDVANAIAEAQVNLDVTYAEPFFDQPGFVKTVSNQVRQCLEQIPQAEREKTCILFTAHSLPQSDPRVDLYVEQINRSTELVSNDLNHGNWQIAFQSRSGRPQDPWLEPDVNDVLRDMGTLDIKNVVIVPIGFVCDNIEVLYDLDTQAQETAEQAGITFFRAKTVGDDPEFIGTLAELVAKAHFTP